MAFTCNLTDGYVLGCSSIGGVFVGVTVGVAVAVGVGAKDVDVGVGVGVVVGVNGFKKEYGYIIIIYI